MTPPKITPKNKAKELFDKYIYYVEAISETQQIGNARECALIFVEETLWDTFYHNNGDTSLDRIKYWQEVKKEINKI
jgi:hypothetical protein